MKMSILIPDGEEGFVMRAAYCLSMHKEIKIYIMSNTKNFPMRYSRYLHKIVYINSTNDKDWVNDINKTVDRFNIDLIMPVSEIGIKTLITFKDLLIEKNKLVTLSHIDDYSKALDKSILAKHLVNNNIAHPKTIIYKPSNIDALNFESLKFPIIIKPAIGYGGEGIHVFENGINLKNFLNDKAKPETYVIQEFINGYDIDCSVLCDKGEIVASTIQKGTLYEDQQFAPAIGLEFSKNDQLLDTVKKLMKSLNWSGLAHIDLRYDSEENKYKIIEINGRFWSSMDASLAAGVNFPYLYCLMSTNQNLEDNFDYKNIKYLNLKGLFKTIRKNPKFLLKFSFIKNNTPLFFSIKDPLPVMAMFYKKLKSNYNSRYSSVGLLSYQFIDFMETTAIYIK